MVCDLLKNSLPKAVVHCQVREAKHSLLDNFYTQVGKREVWFSWQSVGCLKWFRVVNVVVLQNFKLPWDKEKALVGQDYVLLSKKQRNPKFKNFYNGLKSFNWLLSGRGPNCSGTSCHVQGKQLAQMLDEDPALMERRNQLSRRLELYKSARDEIDSVAWAK